MCLTKGFYTLSLGHALGFMLTQGMILRTRAYIEYLIAMMFSEDIRRCRGSVFRNASPMLRFVFAKDLLLLFACSFSHACIPHTLEIVTHDQFTKTHQPLCQQRN